MSKKIKQVVVTGGKGGTGKSTVTVLLASKFIKEGKKVMIVDCDVECPNDYLLVGQRLKKPVDFVYANFPKLIKSKCKKCGLCAKACKSNAIFQAPGKYPVFLPELCSACGVCWLICPEKAIKPKKVKTGKIFTAKIKNNLWLITGLAKPALEETGPVVAGVKKFALNFARKKKIDLILFDTAPGTHCPVIQAVLNTDSVYVVTEPTPMGAYDLNLILDLLKKLKVSAKIILNQADLGEKKEVEKIARKYKTKIVKEIPYSKKLVKAYSRGQLLNYKNL